MINVLELYNFINDLARKHRSGGYTSDDQFNRMNKSVETSVFQHFAKIYEDTQDIVDHLNPFVVYNSLLPTDKAGTLVFPSDYAHRVNVGGLYIQNPKECGEGVTIVRWPCVYLRNDEVNIVQSSVIKGVIPSVKEKTFYHVFRNNAINILPADLYWVELTYLRYPVFGEIKFTMTEVNGEDVLTYDPVLSKNLEWNQITFNHIVGLHLMGLGIELNTPDLIQYALTPKPDGVLT